MTESSNEFRAEVTAALAGSVGDVRLRGSDDHPTLDDLIAYHQGGIEDAEAERVQEHLVLCGECLDRLTELDGFVEAGAQGPPEVGSLEEAAAWRVLRHRLAAPSRTVPLALAASFLVAAIGLGLWAIQQRIETARLREQLTQVTQPQPAATIMDLYSESTVRGAAEKPSPVDLSSVDHLTVILNVPESPDVAAYETEIVDSEDRALWRGRVQRDEHGTIALGIPRPFLDAGSYRIVLYGVTGDRRQRIETFPLDLVSSAE